MALLQTAEAKKRRKMYRKKFSVCSKSKSTCTKKGLKAELTRRGYSHAHLAKLGGVSTVNKKGQKRTKKVLIKIIMKRKARTVARKLGLTLVA